MILYQLAIASCFHQPSFNVGSIFNKLPICGTNQLQFKINMKWFINCWIYHTAVLRSLCFRPTIHWCCLWDLLVLGCASLGKPLSSLDDCLNGLAAKSLKHGFKLGSSNFSRLYRLWLTKSTCVRCTIFNQPKVSTDEALPFRLESFADIQTR